MKIIVNGEEKNVDADTISYGDIVEFSWGPKYRDRVFSVVYQGPRTGDSRRSGSVTPGQTLKLDEGMVISCMDTSNA